MKFKKDSQCVKCGERLASYQWKEHGDYMLRVCQCCGYSWREDPLDTEREEEIGDEK